MHNNPHALHGDGGANVDEYQKHSLSDKHALDCVTHIGEGSAISIKSTFVLGTALTLVREAEDTSDDYQGEVCAAAEAMSTSTKEAARPKNSSSSAEDKYGENAVDQIKVRVESKNHAPFRIYELHLWYTTVRIYKIISFEKAATSIKCCHVTHPVGNRIIILVSLVHPAPIQTTHDSGVYQGAGATSECSNSRRACSLI